MKKFLSLLIFSPIMALSANDSSYIEKVLPSVTSLTIYSSYGHQPHESMGTGFVYNDNGIIITNAHVVKGTANKIIATFSNNQNCFATVQGVDDESDIATLKLEPGCQAPKAMIGNDEKLKIGDKVIAIGNPLGLSQTVTQGIVSSLHRDGIFPDRPSDFIQTDAVINPGNSGGPLINQNGEVIGINTAFITSNPNDPSPANSGMGLAIPMSTATPIIQQLIHSGTVTRGYVGLIAQELSHSMAKYLSYPHTDGLIVTKVIKNSPAGQAGLLEGDIVTHVNGQKLLNITQFPLFISSNPPGSKIKINIWRGGNHKTLTIESTTFAHINELAYKNDQDNASPFSGVTLIRVDARSHDNKPLKGLQVIDIQPDSEAFIEGMAINDIITHINDKSIEDFDGLKLVHKKSRNGHAKITINRQGQRRFVALKISDD